MESTTHSIDVTAPLRAVYNQWTQFEDFPRFMEGVVEIRQQGPRTLFWRVNVGGKDKHWEAEILEQVPDTRIVWESIDGAQNRGMIAFEGLDPERTRITLTMEYEPEGFLERAGDALGIPSGQVEGDLNRFRDFIENRKMETGSWRGEIANGETINSTGVASRPDSAQGMKNGNGTIEMESREAPPLVTETREAALSADERTIEEMPAEAILSLPAAESASQFLHETAPRSDERAIEEESRFYSEAGVLAPTHEQVVESRDVLPLVTETEEAPLSADERATDEMPTILSLPAAESGSEPSHETAPLSGERAIEEESQFYREAGVLAPTHDQIAERAYALYVARGRTLGYALEDWLEAEKQLSEEIRKP